MTSDFSPEIMEAKDKRTSSKFWKVGENPANSRFHIQKKYSKDEIKLFSDK